MLQLADPAGATVSDLDMVAASGGFGVFMSTIPNLSVFLTQGDIVRMGTGQYLFLTCGYWAKVLERD